jgi:hypothetical protein
MLSHVLTPLNPQRLWLPLLVPLVPSPQHVLFACAAVREAKLVLEYFFYVFLLLLMDTSMQIGTSIVQLLAAALRTPSHRRSAAEWVPLAKRGREASRGGCRWEGQRL